MYKWKDYFCDECDNINSDPKKIFWIVTHDVSEKRIQIKHNIQNTVFFDIIQFSTKNNTIHKRNSPFISTNVISN